MRNVAETERFERDRRRRAQECEVTKTGLQPVIAHWKIGLYALLRDQPFHRGFFIAELVDQFKVDRLMAGEDTSIRDFFELLITHAATLFDETAEPGIGILHERIQRGARFRTVWLKAIRRGLQRR